MKGRLIKYGAPLATGLIVLAAFIVAKLTTLNPEAPKWLAHQVQFRSFPLAPVTNGGSPRHSRSVNPAYQRIDGWISAVGAAAALGDIDGNGKPDDICLIDPRYDTVSLLPAPNTGNRYAPFALVAPKAAYRTDTTAPMGCLIGDFNEDGATDVLVYYWGRTPIIFQRKAKEALGSSAFTPIELLSGNRTWFTNAVAQGDFDGDGHVDLLFGNYFPDASAVLDARATNRPTMQHSMSRSYNGGGLHLFLWKDATASGPVYSDASSSIPVVRSGNIWGPKSQRLGWTLALTATDLNGDLRPEIYVANDFGPDQLLVNTTRTPGLPSFEIAKGRRGLFTPRSKVLGNDSFKGMGVDVSSVTGDGRPAIAVSNISAPYALIESHFLFVETPGARWEKGRAPFEDESVSRGIWLSDWAWDIKFADLNNSGCPAIVQAIGFLKGERNRWPQLQELAMSNDQLLRFPGAWPKLKPNDDLSGRGHDRVYLQDCTQRSKDAGRYYDVSKSIDLGARYSVEGGRSGTVSRGIAVGDVYGDGRLSLVVARQWMPSVFLCNASPRIGRSIVLNLQTPGKLSGDRPLIGATARLTLADGRVVTGAVDGGSGHSGKRAPEIHLGLGATPLIQTFDVTLRWRDASGLHSEVRRLPAGRYVFTPGAGPTPPSTLAERGSACG